jgi:diphthamide biosynthesis protein 3
MSSTYYDEVEIEDMVFDEERACFYYPCPCGDKFVITLDQLMDGEEVAKCPSCSLIIRVIYDPDDIPDMDPGQQAILVY